MNTTEQNFTEELPRTGEDGAMKCFPLSEKKILFLLIAIIHVTAPFVNMWRLKFKLWSIVFLLSIKCFLTVDRQVQKVTYKLNWNMPITMQQVVLWLHLSIIDRTVEPICGWIAHLLLKAPKLVKILYLMSWSKWDMETQVQVVFKGWLWIN